MKILLIHKFLHPKGGAETYIFQLGQNLTAMGHEVQYFGMEHEGRIVGNRAGAYTKTMDFHHAPARERLSYAFRTIYSPDARRKLRQVLEDFQPDVCHLNNFHYQLTPSILVELRRWRRTHPCKIICTAHDYQLVCPNHMCYNHGAVCEKCFGRHFENCVKGKCIHGSLAKSLVGALESFLWHRSGIYECIDTIICCSNFLKTKLDTDPVLAGKTVVMHNFAVPAQQKTAQKKDYVLYFGRYSSEKGIEELIWAAKALPEIPFIFAGAGPLEGLLTGIPNVRNVGFQQGDALKTWIREARFTVCPSHWYENCPFSVLESLMLGTPVLGANLGGIPELITPGENGELFDTGELEEKLRKLWETRENLQCRERKFDTPETYCEKLMAVYRWKKVLYLTNIEVPYRVRFFNELSRHCDLTVVYERRKSANRNEVWAKAEFQTCKSIFLRGIPMRDENGFSPGILKEILAGYDKIVVGCYNSPSQMLAILVMRLLKIPYLLNIDGEPFLLPDELKTFGKKFFLRGAAGYLEAGEAASRSLHSAVEGPVTPYYFSSLSESEIKSHGEAVCKRDDTILVVAQYLPCKGLDIALDAARRDLTLRWRFVGMGSRTETFLQDFRGKIPKNVEIIPFLQKDELEQAYRSCRLLVLPSRRECWGLVIQEAASYGTPIISTWGSGAAVEFLEKTYPQYLAKPGDGEDLLHRIHLALSSNESEYSVFLKEKAKQYTIERSVQAHLRAFEGEV